MRIVAFVPIKMNNERLPGKNTKAFDNGEPLIHYILDTLSQVEGLDDIYVYCSSERICDFIPDGVRFLKRDPYLDLSTTSFNEVLSTFAEKVDADYYILTHATAPFISKESFEKAIDVLKSGQYDSVLSVNELKEFLWKEGKPFNYSPESIPRTQDLEPLFTETCGMYAYSKDLILNENRRIGHKPYLLKVSKIEALDVNEPIDFEICNAVFNILQKDKINEQL